MSRADVDDSTITTTMTSYDDTDRKTTMDARHEVDAVSLVGGLVLALLAGMFLLAELTTVSVDGRWVAPLVLLGAGGAGLVATLRPRG